MGEDNPHSVDPRFSLYPRPRGCAGWRLATKVMGLTERQYLRRFARMNLCSRAWNDGEARWRAEELLRSWRGPIVTLGKKVTASFGVSHEPFTRRDMGGVVLYILPHPSGRCRTWNDPQSIPRARALLAPLLEAR